MRGRPELYTRYAADQALLNTNAKKFWTLALLLAVTILPFTPFATRAWLGNLTVVMIYAIGGIGLNLVTGFAGQVSLGHAFFIGLGAFTAAFVGGTPGRTAGGLELEMWIWLPLAGLVPMVVGLLVAPLAARVRGLYLAILTLGLVFLGEHIFIEWDYITGGFIGRRAPDPVIAGFNFNQRQEIFGVDFEREAIFYLFCFVLLVILAVLARNLARSKSGRAFAAVRDRDVAAEVMGVPLLKTKVMAFGVSSFYAGICGGLLAVAFGQITPENFGGLAGLLLSVEFLAVILIGGVATISGSIIGAAFVVLLPRFVEIASAYIPFVGGQGSGAFLTIFQVNQILFGALIVAFLILEPRGLFGLWLRMRNYWKAWPFSY
ncbi:MAG: branched-chain amino acid ABC transporter permease [Nitriliruptor sp.]|nr:MAG: branched-chain amino acid ABC transporter permease [Nitriliruptor sp.]